MLAGASSVQLQPCPRCQAANRPEARYCQQCGLDLRLEANGGQTWLPAGACLNQRYEIVRVIASGGMGMVYEARALNLGNLRCAIKALRNDIADPGERAQAVSNFEREASMLAHLNYPKLPRVFDHFDEGNQHYLVMDFVEGVSLEDRLIQNGRRPLPPMDVLQWMLELCEVLGYLHNQSPPIIFRDLKPGNVMLTPDGQVRLIDFGIARFFDPAKRKDTQAFGTPGYSAPEQYGKGQTDARSDVFSLGVILHELLTGYDPAATPFRLPKSQRLNPRLPGGLDAVIQKATRANPAQRYSSVAEFKQALLVLQRDWQTVLVSATQGPAAVGKMSGAYRPMTVKQNNGSCWLWGGALLLLVMVCLCCAFVWWLGYTGSTLLLPTLVPQSLTGWMV